MPRIPLYDQGQLASSMVGTPGVDTSAASGFESAAQSLGHTEDVLTAVAHQQHEETVRQLRIKEAEQREYDKKVVSAQLTSQVAAYKSTYDNQFNTVDEQLRRDHYNNTDGVVDKFTEQTDPIIDSATADIRDPLLKAETETALRNAQHEKIQSLGNWATQRAPDIAKDNVNQIGDNLAIQLNDPAMREDKVLGILRDFASPAKDPQTDASFHYVYGKNAEGAKRKFQEAAAMNYLGNTANTGNIDLLKARINLFDHYIDGRDKEQFYSRILSMAQREKQNQHEINNVDSTIRRVQTNDVVLTTNPTNLDDLRATGIKLQDQWKQLKSMPPGTVPEGEFSDLAGKIKHNQDQVLDFGKHQMERNRVEQDIIYASPEAMNARKQLNDERAKLSKVKFDRVDRDKGLKMLETYAADTQAAARKGYLDKFGAVTEYQKHSGFYTKNFEVVKKRGPSPTAQIQQFLGSLSEKAQQFFQQAPPPAGVSSKQHQDALNVKYQEILEALTTQYKRVHKADPDQAALTKIHNMAQVGAVGAVHGGH